MINSDSSFSQKDSLKYESEFSCIFRYSDSGIYPGLNKILKIGLCNVKWKLTVTYADNYSSYLDIGFNGENLGLHTGILNFQVRQRRFGANNVKEETIQVTKDHAMTYGRIVLKDYLLDNDIFAGTITVFDCDCILKPNEKIILEENIIQLQKDIQIPWKEKLFTDIDIKVGKTCFAVHEFILRSRSPVFAKMFEHDMKESRENCIDVSDTSEIVMEKFLSFLYSGNLEDDDLDTVKGLYSLADKYEVTSLQKTCRSLLISKLSERTVLEILKTSDMHTDEELKQMATQFICDRFPKIEESPEWSSLMDSNIRLASYVLRLVATKCSSSYHN